MAAELGAKCVPNMVFVIEVAEGNVNKSSDVVQAAQEKVTDLFPCIRPTGDDVGRVVANLQHRVF